MKQDHPRGSIVEPPGLYQDALNTLKDPNYRCTCVRQFPIANEIKLKLYLIIICFNLYVKLFKSEIMLC